MFAVYKNKYPINLSLTKSVTRNGGKPEILFYMSYHISDEPWNNCERWRFSSYKEFNKAYRYLSSLIKKDAYKE